MLLSKGFEIEVYTGTPQGEIVGLSDRIVADLVLVRLHSTMQQPDAKLG